MPRNDPGPARGSNHTRGGMSSAEALARLRDEGPNELPADDDHGVLHIVKEVLEEPMLTLLVAAGVVNFVLSEVLDGGLLLATIVIIISIEVFQSRRTENALRALRNLASPRALVVRDGERVRIPGREVVRGDLLLLAEGDRVPADGVVIETTSLSVDESALTGESVPVGKVAAGPGAPLDPGTPGGDGTHGIFSGTLVVKGQATAVVTATGTATRFGRIGTALSSITQERTPMQKEVDTVVRIVATAALLAAVLVVLVYGWTRGSWLQGALAGIATAMSAIPEEFPVVMTVFLALGSWKMSRNHVLARRSAAIEALGAASVICVDKTGTLTMNTMRVSELIIDGTGHPLGGTLPDEFGRLAEFAVLASPVDPFDPMDRAFRDLESEHLRGTDRAHDDWVLIREYPLSPGVLALSHVWRVPGSDDCIIAAKGAPEAIVELCRLDDETRAHVSEQVDRATSRGQRVLAVAAATYPVTDDLPADQRGFGFEYLGLAGLHDPVRPGVAGAIAECARAGVRTVMITGDYPGTAMAIANEIGLDTTGGCVTGAELDAMTDEELADRARHADVFARMVPEQKLRLVRALRADGEVVGMTGDGVNDAPALRAADIGIAMGARGTDVAREAAALVITDDDYSSIVAGIRQGRGIYDNLRKAMAYVVAVHAPVMGMSLFPLFITTWPLVLLPLQIAFLELIIDPACSVVFEAEQPDPRIMERPPRPAAAPLFDRRTIAISLLQGATVLAADVSVYLWAINRGWADDTVRATTFATLVLSNMGLIVVNRSWHLTLGDVLRERSNPTMKWILGAAAALLALTLWFGPARRAFHLGVIPPGGLAVSALAAVAAVGWFETYKWLTRR